MPATASRGTSQIAALDLDVSPSCDTSTCVLISRITALVLGFFIFASSGSIFSQLSSILWDAHRRLLSALEMLVIFPWGKITSGFVYWLAPDGLGLPGLVIPLFLNRRLGSG